MLMVMLMMKVMSMMVVMMKVAMTMKVAMMTTMMVRTARTRPQETLHKKPKPEPPGGQSVLGQGA